MGVIEFCVFGMEEESNVRLVRCPKCENLLPELPDFSVYQCGGCGAILRGILLSRPLCTFMCAPVYLYLGFLQPYTENLRFSVNSSKGPATMY